MPGTNPFDDPDDEQEPVPPSTNPFDSDDEIQGSNPFDNEFHSDYQSDYQSDYKSDYQNESPEDDGYDNDVIVPPSGSAAAEASWQYLGDLPYRRVPIYRNVRWSRSSGTDGIDDDEFYNHGLAEFPQSAIQRRPEILDPREVRALLNTTTVTKVAGCPHGGPIAAVTIPVVGEKTGFHQTEIRIMTNAGRRLASIHFPPRGLDRKYASADIMTIGFTDRTALIVVLRDSFCLTYDLRGDPILQPFHILPRGDGKGSELVQAKVFEGGVAVLSITKQSAVVELLDDHDDPAYFSGAYLGARKILPASSPTSELLGGGQGDTMPPHCALVTLLPTAAHASDHMYAYKSIAVLSRVHTVSRHPEVFLSTTDNSVIVVNSATTEITDVDCRARITSPIVDMTFAPNGRFLACFTENAMLTVISTSFETKVLDFDTSEGSASTPLDMKWCGEDSVVLHWKNLGVLMVGPYGDWLRFPYEDTEHLYLVPEIDCCRVISDNSVEILQRVPPATALLLRLGSIEPAAMLLDAADAFEVGSPASDDAARAITKTGMLMDAIEACTDASTREFDIVTQKRLLRAASYGMHFSYKDPVDDVMMGGPVDHGDEEGKSMPSTTAIKFVAAARKLRIMNALRNPAVGFILTSSQYDAIAPTGVIARLIAMKRPALATSIAKYLRLPKSVQLFARASKAAAFVAADKSRSDAETAEAAIRIINEAEPNPAARNTSSSVNRGGYATVALAANRAGRPGVANLLLMLESSVADKVPALISTGSYADAMAVATKSRDADLIFLTLMELEKTCMSSVSDPVKAHANYLGTVVSKFTSEGFNTLRRYLATMSDVKNVMNLLLRAQRFADAGAVMATRALKKSDPRERLAMLTEAARVLGQGKDTAFHKSCTDEFLELLKDQEILRTKYGSPDVAPECSSVTATIASVVHYGAVNQREQHRLLADVDTLGKKFRVPEKRMWHIKVKAFADSKQWSNLRILADSKTKPPIGFKPFARAAIAGRQSASEISRYIDKITDLEEKYNLFCEANMWKNALEEAFKMKDGRRVMSVKAMCNNPDLQMLADQMLGRMA